MGNVTPRWYNVGTQGLNGNMRLKLGNYGKIGLKIGDTDKFTEFI